MDVELRRTLTHHNVLLEHALHQWLPQSTQPGAEQLNHAVSYAVFPGGKRWRPTLTLLGGTMAGAKPRDLLPAACAIEYVHTASLILDDLPAMDDAALRRGQASVHVACGQGAALLSALALLNRSYELFLRPVSGARVSGGNERLATAAARAIGIEGMVGGQAADLGVESEPDALFTRQRKTTTLVQLAVTAGAIAIGADDRDLEALGRYGECLGAAYQIRDDLLDLTGDTSGLGKSIGQDARHARQTWPRQMKAPDARATATTLLDEACRTIETRFGDCREARLLVDFAGSVMDPLPALTV